MSKKLLIIGFVFPEPNSTAAGRRMLQLLEVFKSYGYKLTFASTAQKTERSFDLNYIGVSEVAIKLNHDSFDHFLNELKPDVVLFDRFMTEEQFGWRVTGKLPKAIRILDTEDLHCLRKGREQAFKEKKEFSDKYLFNETAKREIASIYRCDLSLLISEVEVDILKEKFLVPEYLIHYVPFLEKPIDVGKLNLPTFEERNHFVTIGNFLHKPNYQSVLNLKKRLWPLIKEKLPKAEIHIYGAYPSQKVTELNNEKEGFIIKGFTEDVYQTFTKYKVCLAPLNFGAGLKGKLIDAMKTGTPCVMSSIAAEGLFGKLQPNGFVGDTSTEFVTEAHKLYTNEAKWSEAQQNGFSIINSRFKEDNHKSKFEKVLNNLINSLEEYRLKNFTGKMLQHHTMQSTKYMSKWIEAKNN